jgi:hypothetical protein
MYSRGMSRPIFKQKINIDSVKIEKKSFVSGVVDKIKGWFK